MQVIIDNKTLETTAGKTILEVAKENKINIPTLCYHKDFTPTGNCGICVVEIKGISALKRACVTPVWEGIEVTTNSLKLREYRKTIIELILSNHNTECPICPQNGKCELQTLAYTMDIRKIDLPILMEKKDYDNDHTSVSIVRDNTKCIHCGRCINVCNSLQTVNALTVEGRGFQSKITTAFDKGMANSPCVNCGQCTMFCPVGALRENRCTEDVWKAILDEEKYVVVQEAPSIRATLAEEFGMDPKEVTVGKMYAALREIGFDKILDTNFCADLTIMEEASEFISRVKNKGKLPMLTSCSPGWVKFLETYYNDFMENLSSCKSPMSMGSALIKTYYAKKIGIDPSKIVSVAIMPCTAKKFEAARPEMNSSGYRDTDYVLTTREFVRMIQEKNINFKELKETSADEYMSMYSGAGTIFGATGGVMEAAIRTAYYFLTGKNLEKLDIQEIRGIQGIKEASLEIPTKEYGNLKINVAVVHGLGNVRKLFEKIKNKEKEYHFIEVMACTGGCVGGGGQPYGSTIADKARRGQALYKEDSALPLRCSHDNPEIKMVYKEFLEEPNSHMAHKFLHTKYVKRNKIDGSEE